MEKLSQNVWPAIGKSLGTGISDPLPNGIIIPPGQRHQTALIPIPWSGRVWPRQFCSDVGDNCLLGDCGSSSCWDRSSTNTTLFEVTVQPEDMYYDISLVDGYTMSIDVIPDDSLCKSISCQAPPYLGLGKSGEVVCPASLENVYGCVSDCSLYGLDKDCCRGAFNSADICQPSSTWFKQVCPDAYSYPYDDKTSTNYCQPSNITIIFSCT
ncbi:PR5-like protein [Trichoderma barbatum]